MVTALLEYFTDHLQYSALMQISQHHEFGLLVIMTTSIGSKLTTDELKNTIISSFK